MILKGILLFVAYVLAALGGMALHNFSGFASLIWACSGISLFALTYWSRSLWPAIFLGAFVVNWNLGAPPQIAALIALGNTGEAVLGAYLLSEVFHFRPEMDRLRDIATFIFVVFSSALLSALLAVTGLSAEGILPSDRVTMTAVTWWMGDVVGMFVVTPLLWVWTIKNPWEPRKQISSNPWIEIGLLGIVVFVSSFFGLMEVLPSSMPIFYRRYAVFIGLVWAALRYGLRGVTLVIFNISVMAIFGAEIHYRQFPEDLLHTVLFDQQVFLLLTSITGLTVAALEIQQRNAQKELQNALRLRDEFFSIASHELKTPLTSLRLQIELSEKRYSNSGRPGEDGKLLNSALRQVDRMSHLVETLLDVSRIQAGKFSLNRKRVNLHEIVKDVLEKDCSLLPVGLYRLIGDTEVYGEWDRLRIEQVVANLISNAIKYAPGAPAFLSVKKGMNYAILIIRDYGPGIEKEIQNRIFHRFERGNVEKGIQGLGLGLYISKEIIQAHEGSIRVESVKGSGTAFIIRLPYRSISTLEKRVA